MKKILTLILSACLVFSIASATLPYASETSSTLENFDVQEALQNVKELEASVDDITQELHELDAQEVTDDGISDKYREVRNETVKVIQDIKTTTQTVGSSLKKLSAYKQQIYLAEKDLAETTETKEEVKNNLQSLTTILFKLDKNLYSEDSNEIDELKLFLQSDNIPQTLASDFVVKSITIQMGELMAQLAEHEQTQVELIQKLNKLKINSENQIENYSEELEKLQQKKQYLLSFLELYKDNKFQERAQMEQLFDSMKDVYNGVSSMVFEIKNKGYSVSFDIKEKLKELEDMGETVQQEIHPIAWPVYPISYIYSYFGDQDFEDEYEIPQLGIEIASVQGSPVYSARHGIVYHVAESDGIGINRVMILHTDGYVTSYQYLNDIIVEEGQIVRRGELIGYSGGEPGTRGAGFVSDGANLTFQVFKDGVAIDPFQVLDASIVKNKSVLPENYHIKYLKDKYLRPIDITDLEFMTGSSVLERADQFLGKYAVGIYRELAFREDAAKGTNIDRDFLICVSFAESTLGRHLSTSNNIGNVGNNDRGDRIAFGSALDGARAIADTLNNQYLGQYHTIEQLSRYGNEDGKIYASSEINWQTNITKCLSQIKGYYIPEDYPFRTGPNPNLLEEVEEVVSE